MEAQGGLSFANPFFLDFFIQMKKTVTGRIMWDNCSFSPNPDLIGFYADTNHFQLGIFSDIL